MNLDINVFLARARELGVESEIVRVAADLGLSIESLLGRQRTATFCDARRVLYVALRRKGLSYPEIGRCVGRDHTTVLYAIGPTPRPVLIPALVKSRGSLNERCGSCSEPYGDHLRREPHPLPKRKCVGFVSRDVLVQKIRALREEVA